MKLLSIDISVILLAIITGFISYNFAHRTRRKESFMRELSNSYNQLYHPMNERLKVIQNIEEPKKKFELFNDFFAFYSNPESPIKLLGSSEKLESYFELHELYKKLAKDHTRSLSNQFNDALSNFTKSIESEFWKAHNVIYKDYKKFLDVEFKNPIFVYTLEIILIMKQIFKFLLVLSVLFIYFVAWNKYVSKVPAAELPAWFNLAAAFFTLICTLTGFAIFHALSTMATWDNRKRLKKKPFGMLSRRRS